MLYMDNIVSSFIMGIFVVYLIFKLARQIKETLYVRRIIKPSDYEKKIILRSNYIHIILYGAFVVVYVLNVLLSLNIIAISFITIDLINILSVITILVLLIGEFIIIPKMNSNIRF